MKKLVWTALVALTSATAAAIAVRGLRFAWQRVLHEEPPPQPWWARKLVGEPLTKNVKSNVEPAANV